MKDTGITFHGIRVYSDPGVPPTVDAVLIQGFHAHCEGPDCALRHTKQNTPPACPCGCPACDAIAVGAGIRPPPYVPPQQEETAMVRTLDNTKKAAAPETATPADEAPKRTRQRRANATGPLGIKDKLKFAQRLAASVEGLAPEEQRTLLSMVCLAKPEHAVAMRRALSVLREIPGEADRRAVVAAANSVMVQVPIATVNGAGDVAVEA